jgi:hypothetical protein
LLAELDRRLNDDELATYVRSALAARHEPHDACPAMSAVPAG